MTLRSILFSSVAALGVLTSAVAASAQTPPPTAATIAPDPRSALTPGLRDAGELASNLTLEYSVAPPPGFFDPEALFAPPQSRAEAEAYNANPPRYTPLALANSDMAMSNGRLFVGN